MAVMHYYQFSTWQKPYFLYPKMWNGSEWVYVKPSIWDGEQWVTAVSETTVTAPPASPGIGGVPTINPGNAGSGGGISPSAFRDSNLV